jgi:hypothetical protein
VDVRSLIYAIAEMPGCRVHPPVGLPVLQNGHALPDDLRTFYEACGGAELFEWAAFPISVSSPRNLRPSNRTILVRVTEKELASPEYDFSHSWYIIGESNSFN